MQRILIADVKYDNQFDNVQCNDLKKLD
jgi:hypothetical protein